MGGIQILSSQGRCWYSVLLVFLSQLWEEGYTQMYLLERWASPEEVLLSIAIRLAQEAWLNLMLVI